MSLFHAIFGNGGTEPTDAKGEVQKLLWTNSDPSSTVESGKKIKIDLSNYEGVIIEFLMQGSDEVNLATRVKAAKNETLTTFGAGSYYGSTAFGRLINTIDDTGVTFGTTSAANYIIPFKIYGYKKYEEPVSGNLKLVEGYSTVVSTSSSALQYYDIVNNSNVSGNLLEKHVTASGNEIIVVGGFKRAEAGKTALPAYNSKSSNAIPITEVNPVPCLGDGANSEYGGYGNIAILKSSDGNEFSVTPASNGFKSWSSAFILRFSNEE